MDIKSFVVGFTKGKKGSKGFYAAETNDAGGMTYSFSASKAAPGPKDVNFYDYDGTLLHSYSVKEAQAMTGLPEFPTHKGLICQEWNWTLDEIKSHNRAVNVGATYITDDGKTRFYIELVDMSQATVQLYFCVSTEGDTVVINWGDGTGDQTYEVAAGDNGAYFKRNPILFTHTYEKIGKYMISVDSGKTLDLGYAAYSVFNQNDYNGNSLPSHIILQKVEMGKNIYGIDPNAFNRCTMLKSITMPKGVTTDNPTGSSTYYFNSCRSLKSITIPRGFNVSESLLVNCHGLESVLLPGNSTNIGKNQFSACYLLKVLTIPDTVTSIGEASLSNTNVEKMFLPKKVKFFGKNAFNNCYALREVVFEGTATTFESAFYNCYNLESFNRIPDGVATVSNSMFYACYKLKGVELPESVTSIGTYAFFNCNNLQYINIPNSVKSIGQYAFSGCNSLLRVNIPEGISSIPKNVFYRCDALTDVELPASVTSIGEYAFYECDHLKSINIPDGVQSIEQYTFNGCKSLASIYIPDSVSSIAFRAFYNCTSLKLVDFSNHMAVPALTNKDTFSGTHSDLEIRVPAALYDEWIAATNWSSIASKIVAV